MKKSYIETISFRLIDTQLLQFLWAASANDIKVVFAKFHDLVRPYQLLSELVSDPGLIPYWCEQAEAITRSFERGHIRVFSDSPLRIPASSSFDLIYVSDGLRHFDEKTVERLREHLTAKGHLAVLAPATVSGRKMEPIDARFADSKPVREAQAAFRELLENRGYYLTSQEVAHRNLRHKCIRREAIRFSVLAPANLVLIGELILISLYEHISDRARLEILNEVAARYRDLRTPVNEKLQLYIMGANQ
jgi:SAM-dependent methyltransferase